ncbi:hypothetical protein [Rhodococcus sp. 5G237]
MTQKIPGFGSYSNRSDEPRNTMTPSRNQVPASLIGSALESSTAIRPDHLDWVVPEWWVPLNGRRTDISRQELITLWVKQPPPPNGSTFRDPLNGWCTDAATVEWVRERYTAYAVARLRDKQSHVVEDVNGWNRVSALIAEYLDSFTRFSLGFASLAKSYRPSALPKTYFPGRTQTARRQALSLLLDEASRSPVVTAVKWAMIHDDEGGLVFESRANADRFLADPEPYRPAIAAAVMRAYGSKLLELVARVDDHDLFDDTVREAVDLLADTAERIRDEFGDLDEPPRRLTPEEDTLVREYMKTAPSRWLAGEDSTGTVSSRTSEHWPDILSRAVERTGKALRKAVGQDNLHFSPAPDGVVLHNRAERSLAASIFWSSVRFAARDVRREIVRERTRNTTPVITSSDRHTPTRTEHSPRGGREYNLVDALEYLRHTPLREFKAVGGTYAGPDGCWEKTVASGFFTTMLGQAATLAVSTRTIGPAVRAYTLQRFDADDPSDTIRSTDEESAALVVALVLESINAARIDATSRPGIRPSIARRVTESIDAYNRRITMSGTATS